jgi:hypothetical protein
VKRADQALFLNKLRITFDELPRLHHNGEASSGVFKVLYNDIIATREMHSNDEAINLECDCDFKTTPGIPLGCSGIVQSRREKGRGLFKVNVSKLSCGISLTIALNHILKL